MLSRTAANLKPKRLKATLLCHSALRSLGSGGRAGPGKGAQSAVLTQITLLVFVRKHHLR